MINETNVTKPEQPSIKYFLFFLILILLSCSKDEVLPVNQTLECLGTVTTSFGVAPCDSAINIASEYLCEVKSAGAFQIQDESKAFMPQYCLNVGDEIEFVNENNEELVLTLNRKGYHTSQLTSRTIFDCEADSMKAIGYCILNERIFLDLGTANEELRFIIEIKTIPDNSTVELGKIGDQLTILRDREINMALEFSSIINQGSLTYSQTYNQEFHTTIEILGDTFSDVFSNNISNLTFESFKYYYNSTHGLIAFMDTDGIVWKLK